MTETDSEAEFHKILGVHPLIQLYLYWQAVFGRFILSIFFNEFTFLPFISATIISICGSGDEKALV